MFVSNSTWQSFELLKPVITVTIFCFTLLNFQFDDTKLRNPSEKARCCGSNPPEGTTKSIFEMLFVDVSKRIEIDAFKIKVILL